MQSVTCVASPALTERVRHTSTMEACFIAIAIGRKELQRERYSKCKSCNVFPPLLPQGQPSNKGPLQTPWRWQSSPSF
jgi:hypothetical protein